MTARPRDAWARPRWVRWLPWIVLGGFTSLWCARWVTFPLLIDPYYHLMVARQVVDAGGPIAYEWWEAAPLGRPHLYPPAIHLLLAGLLSLGCSPIVGIRLVTALLPPCLLLTIYLVTKRLFTPEIALSALLMGLVPFSWILQTSHGLASGVALIELLWLLASAAQGRWAAAAALLTLLFYTHRGFPWVGIASLTWCLALKGMKSPRKAFMSMMAAVLLGLPWLWHVARHWHLLGLVATKENDVLDLAMPLYVLAAIGGWHSIRQSGAPRILLGLWLGFCLTAYPLLYRWVSGEGLLPVILLAGYGLERLAKRMAATDARPAARWAGLLALGVLVLALPTLRVSGSTARILWPDTVPFHLVQAAGVEEKRGDLHLYGRLTSQVVDDVVALTRPGEIIWSNASYTGRMVAALAHRAISSVMLYDVPPREGEDPAAGAHLIVWFKIDPLEGVPALSVLKRRYQMHVVRETPVALLLRNPVARQRSHRPEAVIPWWLAFVLSCGLIGLTVWDFRRKPGAVRMRHG